MELRYELMYFIVLITPKDCIIKVISFKFFLLVEFGIIVYTNFSIYKKESVGGIEMWRYTTIILQLPM